jgi:nitroreductase
MELRDVMTSAGSCRYFRPDPVDEETLYALFDVARFAPSGGNRQPVRFVVVRDPAIRARLAELYLGPWERYYEASRAGTVRQGSGMRAVEEADHFARHLHEIPVLVMVAVRWSEVLITDGELDRPSFVGGASVWPVVQNLLLAAREQGLGATLTTLLAQFEPEIRPLLGLPDDLAVVGTVALGWPARPLPTRLRRRPVEELVSLDRYGEPLAGPAAASA